MVTTPESIRALEALLAAARVRNLPGDIKWVEDAIAALTAEPPPRADEVPPCESGVTCLDCDAPMYLVDGMEWPEEVRCWGCLHALATSQAATIAALRDDLRVAGIDARAWDAACREKIATLEAELAARGEPVAWVCEWTVPHAWRERFTIYRTEQDEATARSLEGFVRQFPVYAAPPPAAAKAPDAVWRIDVLNGCPRLWCGDDDAVVTVKPEPLRRLLAGRSSVELAVNVIAEEESNV